MVDPDMQGAHKLRRVELQVNSKLLELMREEFKYLGDQVVDVKVDARSSVVTVVAMIDPESLLRWAKRIDERVTFRLPSPLPSDSVEVQEVEVKVKSEVKEAVQEVEAKVQEVDAKVQEAHVEEKLNGVVEMMVKADMLEEEVKDMKNGEVEKEEEDNPGTKARGELIRHPWTGNDWDSSQESLLNKKKCDHLHRWFKSVGTWCQARARASTANEFSAACMRAEQLVKECSDDEKWLLKAVELWECVEHFVEVVLDLCWSGYIMCLGNHGNSCERSEHWMSKLNELLESRSGVEAKCFHEGCIYEGCSENDKRDLDAMVQKKLLEEALEVNSPEHQLANLLRDRLQNQSEWRPSFLQRHRFSIYHNLVVPSTRSSKTGAQGAILKFKWVYDMDFALKMRGPNAHSKMSFQEEFEKLHKYRSPYIVGVVGYWEVEASSSYNPFSHETISHPFLLMENLDCDLKDLMDRCKSRSREQSQGFSELETIYLMLPIAKALRFLHAKDVAHRDLKPENIMCKNVTRVGQDTIVKLIDFGEAMENASKPRVDPSGRAATPGGTPGYMDPTIRKPKKDAMDYSPFMGDVFSFAVVFTELLTWRSPVEAFGVRSPRDAQAKLQAGEKPSLPNDTSDYVRFIVESCWHADHMRRPDFKAICSMLQHAKFLLSEKDFAFDPEDFFSYEDATGGNCCMPVPQ